MQPSLRDGDLLAVRAPHANEPRAGQIVVVRTPKRELVKRVTSIENEQVHIEGDNRAHSTGDGQYARTDVVGVVVFRYWPVWRARLFK